MEFIKFILNRNKSILFLSIMAIIIHLSYDFTMDMNEWFIGADIIYKFIAQVALAFIGGVVFFIVQSEYKDFNIVKRSNARIKPKLEKLSNDIKIYFNNMYINTVKNDCYSNFLEQDFEKVIQNISLDEEINIFNSNGNRFTTKQYMIEHKNKISQEIKDIYVYMGENIDNEIKDILEKISSSRYFEEINMLEKIKLGQQNPIKPRKKGVLAEAAITLVNIEYKCMFEYYDIYNELNNYIKKI